MVVFVSPTMTVTVMVQYLSERRKPLCYEPHDMHPAGLPVPLSLRTLETTNEEMRR